MKLHAVLPTLLLAVSATSLAQTPPPPPTPPAPPSPPGTHFEQHKAAMIAKLQARIARDQALVSCLQGAQNRAAIKACKLSAPPVH